MTEHCRLITEEQYKEWKASEKKLAELKQELAERFPCNCFSARLERERLQKKLDIAIKALKGIGIWGDNGNGGEQACKTVAINALKKMEEV